MFEIREIDPLTDARWDRFVENHPMGWITHLSGWKSVLESCFPHMKGHYFALIDRGCDEIRAALPVFEVRSWLTGKRLVSIPYATLSDPLVSDSEELELLLGKVKRLAKELGSSFVEVRTLNSSSLFGNAGLATQHGYMHHYIDLPADPEQLMKSFHRSCVRQPIMRAMKSDLVLKTATDEKNLKQLYHLYTVTRKRLGLFPQPYKFFQQLWKVFQPSGRVSVALVEYDGRPVAGLLLLKFKERVSAEYAVINEMYQGMNPNHLLFWDAIRTSCADGYKIFDFGRTAQLNQSLINFKSRWGAQSMDLYNFYYPENFLANKGVKEETFRYKLASEVGKKMPNAVFSLTGNLCYRHLG